MDLDVEESQRMTKECNNLLDEIERLEMERKTHTERLKNAMNLVSRDLDA